MVKSTTLGATLLLLLSLSAIPLLAKEHIATAALLLALLSAFHYTRIQQRRIEKLEDEYKGQRAINLAAAEKNRAAYLALQQKVQSASSENTTCARAHYEHPSAELVRENRQLKEGLHRLRLSGKTSTCTRTHYEHSTIEIACANHVLVGTTRKLRATVDSLKYDTNHREKAIKTLQRSLETLRATRAEEVRDKDAAAARHSDRNNDLYRLKAAAHHNDRYKAVYRSRAAAQKAETLVKGSRVLRTRSKASKVNTEGRAPASTEVANSPSGDVDQERIKSGFSQESVGQVSETRRSLSPKCATVEDDDEEEL